MPGESAASRMVQRDDGGLSRAFADRRRASRASRREVHTWYTYLLLNVKIQSARAPRRDLASARARRHGGRGASLLPRVPRRGFGILRRRAPKGLGRRPGVLPSGTISPARRARRGGRLPLGPEPRGALGERARLVLRRGPGDLPRPGWHPDRGGVLRARVRQARGPRVRGGRSRRGCHRRRRRQRHAREGARRRRRGAARRRPTRVGGANDRTEASAEESERRSERRRGNDRRRDEGRRRPERALVFRLVVREGVNASRETFRRAKPPPPPRIHRDCIQKPGYYEHTDTRVLSHHA